MKIIKEKISDNLMSFVYIIVGLIMLINPKFVCDAVNYIIGGLIILVGIFFVIKLLQSKDLKEFSKIELLISLLLIGLGIFLMFNSNLLTSILPIASGLLIFLDSVSQIRKSFELKKKSVKLWYVNLIIGLIFFGFSLYIIFNATSVTYFVIRFIGIILIIDAILEFYTSFKLNEYNHNVKVIETEIVKIENK